MLMKLGARFQNGEPEAENNFKRKHSPLFQPHKITTHAMSYVANIISRPY